MTSRKEKKDLQHYVIVDVETTGFNPQNGDEIIEIAAERMREDEVISTFHSLVRPSRPSSAEAEAVHGISQELLEREGKNMDDIIDDFVMFIDNAVLVGHNISFDLSFLNSHLVRLSRAPLAHPTIDTLELARRHLLLPRYTLENVARYLKVPQPEAHRALADVQTTRQVFLKLRDREAQRTTRQRGN